MAVHGRVAVFKLDDLAGALQDISARLNAAGFAEGSDRPPTTTFGETRVRRTLLGLRTGDPIPIEGYVEQTAGTKIHGRQTRLMLDEFAFGGQLRDVTVRRAVPFDESQTFGDDWRERDVVPLGDGGADLSGLYGSAAGETDPVFRAALAAAVGPILSIAPNGFAIGNLVDMLQGAMESRDFPADVESMTEDAGVFQADDGVDLGVSLHDHVAETGTGTVNYASVDETAATSEGGVAHLHVTAFSGWTNSVIKVQHSTDNSVWSDLTTFATVTGVTKERRTVAGTVNRYVRAQAIQTGASGSITFQVSFARRGYAYGAAGTYRHFCGLYLRAASSSFEYGPEGGTTGKRKYSGECRLSSLETTYNTEEVTAFSAELTVTGAVAEGTFS